MKCGRKKPRWLLRMAIVLPASLLLYVASIGPMVWLLERGYLSPGVERAWTELYEPLFWFKNQTTDSVALAIEEYMDLWSVPDEGEQPGG